MSTYPDYNGEDDGLEEAGDFTFDPDALPPEAAAHEAYDPDDEDDDFDYDAAEEALITGLLDATGGDVDRTIELLRQHEAEMADDAAQQHTADAADQHVDELEEWLDSHADELADPDALAEWESYLPHVNGNRDAALELLQRSREVMAEANRAEGRGLPTTFDEAFTSAQDDLGFAGGSRYQHRRSGHDSAMDDAMGAFAEELSARNGVKRQARARLRRQG